MLVRVQVVGWVMTVLHTPPHLSRNQRDEGSDRVEPRKVFGLPAARRAAVPSRLRASMRGSEVGGGVGGKGVPLGFLCAEEEVGVMSLNWKASNVFRVKGQGGTMKWLCEF